MDTTGKLSFAVMLPGVIKKFGNREAVGFVDEPHLSYHEMGQRVSALMDLFGKLGLVPGDKVAILSQNMPNWGIAYFATQCMGLVAVPILPDFHPREIANVLEHSGSSMLIISKDLEYKLNEITSADQMMIMSMEDFQINGKNGTGLGFDADARCTLDYDPDPENLAVLIYTSGTTGDSKGVMLSQKNILVNARQGGSVQAIEPGERFLSVLPLAHTYENTLGLILPLLNGACISYLRKPPTASVLLPALQSVRPHYMLTVPMIIEKVYRNSILPTIHKKPLTSFLHRMGITRKLLYRLAGKKLFKTFGGRLKFFGIGGSKLDPVVEKFLRDARFPYAIGYGLTESSPLLAGSGPAETRFQAIGPAVPEVELKIDRPDPRTGQGEILAKGPNIMIGYFKNKAKTREVLSEDGWFHTGDLGVIDRHGYLSHRGRLKNMIVGSSGENIYPEEIETLINNFRHVTESLVLQQKGRLVALVHFNREELEQKIRDMKNDLSQHIDDKLDKASQLVEAQIQELSDELYLYVNSKVNKFSRIQAVIVHPEPFQRTATQKIKRYLYN